MSVASVIQGALYVERLLIINMCMVWEKRLQFNGAWHVSPALLI